MNIKRHLDNLVGPLVALFITYKDPDELLLDYKRKMVAPTHWARNYEINPEKIDLLRAMYSQGQEYVKHHSNEMNELLGEDLVALKRPAVQALHDLRWHLSKLDYEDYLIAHAQLTEEMSRYADFVYNVVQQEVINKVIEPVATGDGHPDLIALGAFGNCDLGES